MYSSDLNFPGTRSCIRNTCWYFTDWCSCWWRGGNGKCATVRFWN